MGPMNFHPIEQLKGLGERARQLAGDVLRKWTLHFGDSLMAPTLSSVDTGVLAQLKYFLVTSFTHLYIFSSLLTHLTNISQVRRLGPPVADTEVEFEEQSIH